METIGPTASAHYPALLERSSGLVVGLDFDGTLAPIVDDPTQAWVHVDVPDLLVELAGLVRGVAVVTGRPVRQAMELGGLDDVGLRIDAAGGDFAVLGQYGNERWSATERRVVSPRPPHGLASFLREVPGLLRNADAADAWVESKGLAVALHTRRMEDAQAAYDRLLPLVHDAATRHGLVVEPGRLVAEVRAPGMDKGKAVRRLATDWEASAFLFAGDDLGDVEAFTELKDLRACGVPVLLVCAHTGEGPGELMALSDAQVDGPEGVVAFLRALVADLRAP